MARRVGVYLAQSVCVCVCVCEFMCGVQQRWKSFVHTNKVVYIIYSMPLP